MNIKGNPSQKHSNYIDRFNTAIEKTKELRSKIDSIVNKGKPPSNIEMINACSAAFKSKFNMAHNCPHTAAVNALLKNNGFNSGHITIGYLSYDNDLEYECSVGSLSKEIDSDSEEVIPMHVWITFPDGTILDPTLRASFEKDAGRLEQHNINQLPIISPCDFPNFPIEIEYFPLLVGKDYLLKASSIIEPSIECFNLGRQAASKFYNDHIKLHNIGSFNEMKSFYKENDREKYRDIVSGFRTEMNHLISSGLVKERKHNNDTLYYASGHADLVTST
jgi:hypothetical protein